jgi:tetraprenyl-beta-curcumene synthase
VNVHRERTIRTAVLSRAARRERTTLATTFAGGALSYWLTVFPRVCIHVARWRRLARAIPDPELRRLALASLAKRGNIEGAAAFAAFVPRARRAEVTLATCAFQAAYNLLDILGEQPSEDPIADGRRLHEALLYALACPLACAPEGGPFRVPPVMGGPREGDADAQPRDWYELHPLHDDGGYLQALLDECRSALRELPAYEAVALAARAAAERIVAFQSLNLSEAQGDHTALERWAREATPAGTGLTWWETAAAAGSSLGVYVLIAAAAAAEVDDGEIAACGDAYFPWIGALHSLLDSLVDSHEDAAAGHRSLTAYYDSPQQAATRMTWIAEQAMRAARALPHGTRHTVILAAMIGNYVSTPQTGASGAPGLAEGALAVTGPLRGPTLLVFKLRRLRRTH